MSALPRILPDFLTAWLDYTEFLPAPRIFKEWAGLFLITAALTRRVWVTTDPTYPPIYPNVYGMLVCPPGGGKDMIINLVRKLMEEAHEGMPQGSGFTMAQESISAKGLLDILADDDSEFNFSYTQNKKKHVVKFHSVIACIPELGTLLPEYNTHLVAILNELYNCKPVFRERIRGHGNNGALNISNPHVSMLLGTQPTTLSETFPEQAYRMGFFSRTHIIYSPKTFPVAMYDDSRPDRTPIWDRLVTDLRSMGTLAGPCTTTPGFRQRMNEFHLSSPDALTHSRFEDYNARRSLHLHKLAIGCCVSEGSKLILTEEHFDRALAYLLAAEKVAPSVFESLTTSSGFSHTVEQVLTTRKQGEIITHAELERRLRRTHRPYEVGQILRSMIAAGDLEPQETKNGMPVYVINNKAQLT